MNIKTTFFILLFTSLLFKPLLLDAQDAPPANAKVISVTTTADAEIRISLYATASETPVWIETSSGNFIKKFVGGANFDTSYYTVSGTSLKAYGNLSYFDCSENNSKITAIDVTQNSTLRMLACNNNNISSLDVTNNTDLRLLTCNDNNLSSLDLSQNKGLINLMCYNNNLNDLDVSQNTALTQLWCTNNNISSLDVSQNKSLTELWCGNNNIQSLDISENTALKRLYTKNNKLVSLNVANGNNANFEGYSNGKAFDATGNPNLKCIQIDEGFNPPATGNNNWLKDETATWNTNCLASTNDIDENVVKIYPNPTKNWVILETNKQINKIQVFDSTSKLVRVFNNPTKRVSIQDLSIGTYIFKLFYDNKAYHIKVIKN